MLATTEVPESVSSSELPPYFEDEGLDEFFASLNHSCYAHATPIPNDGVPYCPRVFDGWSCWNSTPAGHLAYAPCPEFVTGFDPRRIAFKVCTEDGSWYKHPSTDKPWSNYTTCVDMDDLNLRKMIITLYITGYAVSMVFLACSLLIFVAFRSLQCTRITIHKNLFASFLIDNILWIVWFSIMYKPEVLVENSFLCQTLHVVLHWFLVCNYFWMFCEGLHLHTVLVQAFIDEEKMIKWFYLIGWGIPTVLTLIYAAVRSQFHVDTEHCWINDSVFTIILSGPACLSLIINFVFLINILRILVTKLRSVTEQSTNQTRKAVRATLILIPLLGLHYLVTPFRPEPGSQGEDVYQMISAAVTSFQGLAVSLLFCFLNGEVLNALRRKLTISRV